MFTSHSAYRSIHIVALGSECPGGVGQGEEILGQGQLQGGLLWSYLGHGALVGHCDLEDSLHNPAFMEYTSRVFGDVTVVVRDCPSWVRDTLSTWGALGWGNNGPLKHTAVKPFRFEALSSRLQPFFLKKGPCFKHMLHKGNERIFVLSRMWMGNESRLPITELSPSVRGGAAVPTFFLSSPCFFVL